MCLPAAAVAIGQFVIGAVSSIAQYQQQQQAAQADYQAREYAAQAQYQAEMVQYRASEAAYNQRIESNRAAANRGYEREQLLLQQKRDEASQRAQDLFIQKIQSQGTVLAAGRTGKSIALLTSDAEREYGRDLANLGTNLGYASASYGLNTQDIYSEAKSANNLAASQRMLEPQKSWVAPAQQPSTAGLLLGIGESALSAAGTYGALKAPKANIPTPNRASNMPGTPNSLAPSGKPYYGPAF